MIEKILESLRAELLNLTFRKSDKCKGFNDGIHTALKIVQEESKNGGWIPCSSGQMPEDGENVLIWFEYFRYGDFSALYQRYGIGFVWNGKWSRIVNDTSGWQKLRIIAWQPLPAPYQEGD